MPTKLEKFDKTVILKEHKSGSEIETSCALMGLGKCGRRAVLWPCLFFVERPGHNWSLLGSKMLF